MTQSWYELDTRPRSKSYWAAVVRKQPSAILLGVQILLIVMLPVLQEMTYGRGIVTGVSFVAVTLAMWTVRATPALTWVALLIGLPAFVLEVWSVVDETNTTVTVVGHVLLGFFYLYVAYGLIAYMFADSWVTKDELFAVGAAFTVLMYAFAYLYTAIQSAQPGSFVGHGGSEPQTLLELLYFSAACLTSVGLSDIVAISPYARAVAILEQLAGVLYVAMVISRLVALTVIKARG